MVEKSALQISGKYEKKVINQRRRNRITKVNIMLLPIITRPAAFLFSREDVNTETLFLFRNFKPEKLHWKEVVVLLKQEKKNGEKS